MSFILDPAETAFPGRTELELYTGPLTVRADGIDWGDTEVEQYMAQAEYGDSSVDFRIPNRTITLPLVMQTTTGVGATTMIQAMANLQSKVARLATEGGSFKRTRKTMKFFGDIVNATATFPDTWTGENRNFESEGQLVLECLPDFYGEELTKTINGGSAGANGFLNDVMTGIKGSYPARCRILVGEASGQNQRGLAYGIRGRNYSNAATAKLVYEAEALGTLNQSTIQTIAGASPGSNNVIQSNILPNADFSPIMSTDISGSTKMTHVGTYRLMARVRTPATLVSTDYAMPYLRFVYSQGDLVNYTTNDPVQIPGGDSWYLVDLGEVRLTKPQPGAQRWQGVIQGKDISPVGSVVYIDKIFLRPMDEASALLKESPSKVITPAGFSVNDPFNQTAGVLVGKTAVPAGTYAALIAGGTDFSTTGSGKARRTAGGVTNGVLRLDGIAAGLSDVQAHVEVDCASGPVSASGSATSAAEAGLVVRGVNSTDYMYAKFVFPPTNSTGVGTIGTVSNVTYEIGMVIAGSTYVLHTGTLDYIFSTKICEIDMTVYQDGSYTVMMDTNCNAGNYGPSITKTGQRAELAQGGALASGGVYMLDRNAGAGNSTTAWIRDWDNFRIATTVTTAALFYAQQTSLQTDGCWRRSADGAGWGAIVPYGDLPRLPVAGKENRSTEILLMNSRGDFDTIPDSGLDAVACTVYYRPCWSSVPEA